MNLSQATMAIGATILAAGIVNGALSATTPAPEPVHERTVTAPNTTTPHPTIVRVHCSCSCPPARGHARLGGHRRGHHHWHHFWRHHRWHHHHRQGR